MSNYVVSFLSDKNPDKEKNEDLIGLCGNVFWLLDGATLPTYMLSSKSSITSYDYVQNLNHAILQILQMGQETLSLKDIVKMSIENLLKDNSSIAASSTIAMVRVNPHSIEYFVLGDSSLLIQANSVTLHITDQRLELIGTDIRKKINSLLQAGHGFQSSEVEKWKRQLIELELVNRNKPNGYYIASTFPGATDRAFVGEKRLNEEKWKVVLMSDGASQLVNTFYKIRDWEQFVHQIQPASLKKTIQQIRELENNDPNGQQYPRFRKHDDTSILLIEDL